MTWPAPHPGLVIRYSYLWHREAVSGQEEGSKDRPCAVVLAIQDDENRTRVYALPVTHSPPAADADAVEIPAVVKARLGLDGERSWVVVDEANLFNWPGPDLRFLPGKGPESTAYGFLPPGFFRIVRDRFLAADRNRKSAVVKRTE
ncbi:MAG: hypothetical protein ACJ8AW_03455 [Rhodopila sp.]